MAKILFKPHAEQSKDRFEADTARLANYTDNHLFCRFHHLFEYEATYYSYLIAKVTSRSLYSSGDLKNGLLSKRDRDLIFVKPGETINFAKEVLLA